MLYMSFFSSFLEDFFKEIIFTLFFSSGLMAVYIAKMRKALNETSIGITHVHKHGKDVKNLIKAMQSAREINIIAFVPFSFVFDNRELLTKKIKDGCMIRILLCQYDSPLLKEISQIERNSDYDIANQIDPLINMLKCIKNDAGVDSTGSIEVRAYYTEIRNPAIICVDADKCKSAFLTISLPPKRSIDTCMIEYRDSECNDVINYFDAIWNRHANDILFREK